MLNNASVDGLLEILTSKVLHIASSAAAFTGVAGFVGQGSVKCASHVLSGTRQENDLAVGGLGHGLHGFEITDLHGGSRAEDVGSLAHQLGGFDL